MKYFVYLALSVLILSGCTGTSLEGRYINKVKTSLVTEVNFGEKLCRFDYFGIKMSGEFTVDKNFVYIKTGGELGTLAMEIIDEKTLKGEGWISGTFKKQ